MTILSPRVLSAGILLFALLLAPATVDGQMPPTVVVVPFGMQRGPFNPSVVQVDPNLGRAIAADVATQVDGMTTVRLVELDAFLDASPLTREFSEEARERFSCILGMQLVVAENIDLSLCGRVLELREGFEIQAVLFASATMAQCFLPPVRVYDRDSAVRQVLAQFDEWANEVRATDEPTCSRPQ